MRGWAKGGGGDGTRATQGLVDWTVFWLDPNHLSVSCGASYGIAWSSTMDKNCIAVRVLGYVCVYTVRSRLALRLFYVAIAALNWYLCARPRSQIDAYCVA